MPDPMSPEELTRTRAYIEHCEAQGAGSVGNLSLLRRLLDENARLNAELHGRRNLGVEYERLRVENIQLRDQLDAVREIKPQRRNSVFVSSEQIAVMRGWNDAVDAIRAAVNPCECGMTDPSMWETHGGATEPGSAYEWNPDCPAHGAEPIEETAQERAGDTNTSPAGSGRGTGVAEAPGTARAGEAWIPSFAGDECPHRPEWTCPEHDECRACECDCNTYVSDLEEPDLTLIPGDMVVRDPEICSGRPTMRGTRILASRIASELAAGTSWETLREWYPSLPSLPVPSSGEGT